MATSPDSVRRRPVIRVFVSSTFSDLKHERNALQEKFRELEAYCQSRRFQFQAIDLRWGVPSEAGLDHRTMRICFDELRRSQEISPRPNFLILLGDRYGWRPLPEEISTDEFAQLAKTVAKEPITLEILEQWYRRDANAVPPVHVLRSRRDPPDPQEPPHWTDFSRDDRNRDGRGWLAVQELLWSVVNETFAPDELPGRFEVPCEPDSPPPSIVRFQTSATEQEIWNGALRVPDAQQHVFAFVRRIENIEQCLAKDPSGAGLKDFVDLQPDGRRDLVAAAAQQRMLAELKRRLASEDASLPSNYYEITTAARLKFGEATQRYDVTEEHVETLCKAVYDRLFPVVERQIDEYWGESKSDSALAVHPTAPTPERELELEIEAHDRFGAERAPRRRFVGRKPELRRILDYLRGSDRRPLVVYGPSGTGKTALLAHAARLAKKVFGRKLRDRKPIVRYLGTTPHSGTVRSLLTSLCRQLRREFGVPGDPPTELRELEDDFVKLPADYSAQRADQPAQPIFLFLDALDQLDDSDHGRQLTWLRYSSHMQLPEHVKLVVSCLSDVPDAEPAGQPLRVLEQRQLTAGGIAIDELTGPEAAALLFNRWLRDETGPNITPSSDGRPRRTIRSKPQRDYLQACLDQTTDGTECRRPLYLKILYEEARLWRSFDPPPPAVPATVNDLLDGLFRRLRQPEQHGQLLNLALSYLAASRYGLAENELLEVLFSNRGYKNYLDRSNQRLGHEFPEGARQIPIALWSRLRHDLDPFLSERAAPGGFVLNFYHRQVAEFVRRRLLDDKPLTRIRRHRRLATYFRLVADPTGNRRWPVQRIRSYRELAFHLGRHDPASLDALLGDPLYLDARCRMNDVRSLLGDYGPIGDSATGQTSTLHAVLVRYASPLTRYPMSLLSLLDAQIDTPAGLTEHDALRAQAAGRGWLRVRPATLKAPDRQSESRKYEVVGRIDFPAARLVTFSSKGSHLVLITTSGRLGLFDIAAGELTEIDVALPLARPEHLSYSNELAHICAAFEDETLLLVATNTATGTVTSSFDCIKYQCHRPEDAPINVAWIHEGIVWQWSETQLATVRIAAGAPPAPPALIDIPPGTLRGACTLEDGTLVVVRTEAGDVVIPLGDFDSVAPVWKLDGRMIDLCGLPNERLAVAYSDGTIRAYDVHKRPNCVVSLRIGRTPNRVTFVDDAVLVQADDRSVIRWDSLTNDSASLYEPPNGSVTVRTDAPFITPAKSRFLTLESGQIVVGELKDACIDDHRLIAIDDSPAGLAALFMGNDHRVRLAFETWDVDVPELTVGNDARVCFSAAGNALVVSDLARWALVGQDRVCRIGPPIVPGRIGSVRHDDRSGFWVATNEGGFHYLSENLKVRAVARIPGGRVGDVLPFAKYVLWYGSANRETDNGVDHLYGVAAFAREPTGLRKLGERFFQSGRIYAADFHEESGTVVLLFENRLLFSGIDEFFDGREHSIALAYHARNATMLLDGRNVLVTTADGAMLAVNLRQGKCVGMLALESATRHAIRSYRPQTDVSMMTVDGRLSEARLIGADSTPLDAPA